MGNNPSPPQPAERAASEGRAVVTHLSGHSHANDQGNYAHAFQHMLHQHSSWNGQDSTANGGSGPITGGVGTGSASSLTSSSSNEGMSTSNGLPQQTGGGGSSTATHGSTNYHGEKYKYDRLNEADANADNRYTLVNHRRTNGN